MSDIEIPQWIDQNITPYDIAAICQGGCASGAYMPAVSYFEANKTMSEHGDDVLDYLNAIYGELPKPPEDTSWRGLAVFYLSCAVESFCLGLEHLADWEDENPIKQKETEEV